MQSIQMNEPTELQKLMNLCDEGLQVEDIDDCDCGPRFETLLNQRFYLSIWCYSSNSGLYFSLEIRTIADDSDTWLEDGPSLAPDSEIRLYATFDKAFENMSKIVRLIADRSPV